MPANCASVNFQGLLACHISKLTPWWENSLEHILSWYWCVSAPQKPKGGSKGPHGPPKDPQIIHFIWLFLMILGLLYTKIYHNDRESADKDVLGCPWHTNLMLWCIPISFSEITVCNFGIAWCSCALTLCEPAKCYMHTFWEYQVLCAHFLRNVVANVCITSCLAVFGILV